MLEAAAGEQSPVIVQTSARVARHVGPTLIAANAPLQAATALLQLDHCHDTEVVRECVDAGWQAVLFDGSSLEPGANILTTSAVVAQAHARGVAVEGELGAIRGPSRALARAGRRVVTLPPCWRSCV